MGGQRRKEEWAGGKRSEAGRVGEERKGEEWGGGKRREAGRVGDERREEESVGAELRGGIQAEWEAWRRGTGGW